MEESQKRVIREVKGRVSGSRIATGVNATESTHKAKTENATTDVVMKHPLSSWAMTLGVGGW